MRTGLLFILPAFAVYALYFLTPIPLSAYYSLFRWDGISSLERFIGIDNWARIVTDEIFWKSFANNMILVVASIAIQLPIGLVLALFIRTDTPGVRAFKLLYFVPMTISAVAIGLTWRFIYDPNYGLLNEFLTLIGLDSLTRGWLGDRQTTLGAVTATIAWQFIPYYMVIYAAGLAAVPQELSESAAIDGASPWQSFWRITLPLLNGTIVTTVVLSLTGSLKYFGLIYVMTEGGPVHASELMATYMYKQAFVGFRMGYGSTIAVMMFAIALVMTLLIVRTIRRERGS